LQKVCATVSNVKSAFGEEEVRILWDKIDSTAGGIQNLSKIELRTFVMAVFQNKSFCRFSDLAVVKLDDIAYTMDYFKVKISC
jgi:hypothetical protein